MHDFYFHLRTEIHHGAGVLEGLPQTLARYGTRVLFMYDEIPAQVTGAYRLVHDLCEQAGITVTDFTGIEPNPRHTTVDRAVEAARAADVQAIVALGGGSTIDSAKTVSFAVFHEGTCWDFYEKRATADRCLPLITVPTIAASGSEVSNVAVMANYELGVKRDYRTDLMRPVAVFADPTYTYSVPAFQTACGIVDIMCHSYEGYFSTSAGSIQDGFSETIQRTCIEHGRKVMQSPRDYASRSQLLWAAELAISHLADQGRAFVGNIHSTEGVLSSYFHLPHGAGIAITSLAWFKYSLSDATAPRYARWGRQVWGISGDDDWTVARAAIERYERFMEELGLPTRFSQARDQPEGDVLGEVLPVAAKRLFTEVDTTKWFVPMRSEQEVLDFMTLAYR